MLSLTKIQKQPYTYDPSPIVNEIMHDATQPSLRPSRMDQDVWTVFTEYARDGGLLNFSEDIAVLTDLEQKVRGAQEGVGDGKMLASQKTDLILRVTKTRADIRSKHLDAQIRRNEVMTLEAFGVFLNQLFGILQRHIPDPAKLKQIGIEMQQAVVSLRKRTSDAA